ncbi:hypothetical protein ACP70R_002449 [Stipagrostis hirtigluma subsp. patula]
MVQINGGAPSKGGVFTTPEMGDDNAILRHGIHGLQWSFEFVIKGDLLLQGDNTIYIKLTPAGSGGPDSVAGVMYDYIRLEGPSGGIASCGVPNLAPKGHIWMEILFASLVVFLILSQYGDLVCIGSDSG